MCLSATPPFPLVWGGGCASTHPSFLRTRLWAPPSAGAAEFVYRFCLFRGVGAAAPLSHCATAHDCALVHDCTTRGLSQGSKANKHLPGRPPYGTAAPSRPSRPTRAPSAPGARSTAAAPPWSHELVYIEFRNCYICLHCSKIIYTCIYIYIYIYICI